MELRDYLRTLHKYWVLILATTLVGIAVGAGVSILATPQFQATTQLYVSVRGEGQAIGDLAQGSTLARQSVSTYASIVRTESVLGPVIDDLDLDTTSAALAGRVAAHAPLDQSLVLITVTGTDPAQTADIANAVGQSLKDLVEQNLEAPATEGSPSLVSLSTVQPAAVPTAPVSPRVPVNIGLGLLVGLVLGIAAALGRAALDTRIHSLTDIERATDSPILGGIAFDPDADSRPLVVHSDPRSPRAESFRTLRTNLQFLPLQRGESKRGRSFVLTSAGPSEGKSTTAVNLALALAETGSRVALIDGDLRLPMVAKYLGLEGAAGLTNVLIGETEVSDVLQRWGQGSLYILPAGRIPPNPSELLGSRAMGELLDTLTNHFDFVIVDAPPLLLVTDAAVLSHIADGALLVAASGVTRTQHLTSSIQSLGTAGGTLLGVVATMLPLKGPDSTGYGSYGAYGGYDVATSTEGTPDPGTRRSSNESDAGTRRRTS